MDKKENAPGQNMTIPIVINTRAVEVTGHQISYEEVVKLSEKPTGDGISNIVKYRKGNSSNWENVAPGEMVHLHPGMEFHVGQSNRS